MAADEARVIMSNAATGEVFTEVPKSTPEDIELALDAAHAAKQAWGEASTTERAKVLNRVADVIEENLEPLAVAESWENGKPVRETLAADIPLAADHFRYFASVIRGEEGAISEDEVFSTLMGDDVESRKGFIQQNAKDVRFLDI